MNRLKRYPAQLRRRSGRRQLLTTSLLTFGSLWLLVEPLGLFFPDELDFGWAGYGGLIIVGLAAGLYRSRPRSEISRKLPPTDLEVSIRVGDLLSQAGNVIVGTNDTFDTTLTGDIISPRSVQGQLQQTIFGGDTDEFERQLASSLEKHPHEPAAEKTIGKADRYPIGTVAVVRHGDTRYFLPAFTRMSAGDVPRFNSRIEWLQIALTRTWEAVDQFGQRDPVHVPVLGSNFGRLGLTRTLLIQLIVLSFIAASRDHSPASSLNVWVTEADADGIDLAALDDWLRALCAA